MSSIHAGPSTVDGIKRLAKTLRRERAIPHHVALDLAASQAGYQNFRHAQRQLFIGPRAHPVFISAFWARRGGSGRETLAIELPKPLTSVVARHYLSRARNLERFRIESDDHLECIIDVDSVDDAHRYLWAAARTLRFMALTSLRPATTWPEIRAVGEVQSVPGRDHESRWIDPASGHWVFLDEPYRKPELAERAAWADRHGVFMVVPRWGGLYYPGKAIPHLFCAEAGLASRLDSILSTATHELDEPEWGGESAPYFEPFISPARAATGKPRRPRPRPAYAGVERNGALPYGSRRGGEASSWRPAKRMPLELHLAIGPLLYALDQPAVPSVQRKALSSIRGMLDGWLMMEYPGEEMTDDQFHSAYYGKHREPIVSRDLQMEAVRKVATLLQEGYADCPPRRDLLRRLAKVEVGLAKSHRH